MLPNKLNLGCGKKQFKDHLNVDSVASVNPDLVHNLNMYPYPLPESHFVEIAVYDVVEHLEDIVAFMHELWRVSAPSARIFITTPHFSCCNAFRDPTHRHQLSLFSFDYFVAGHQWNYYGSEGFKITHRQILFTGGLTNKVVRRLANRWPECYESRWAWMFPAWYISLELEVVKTSPTTIK